MSAERRHHPYSPSTLQSREACPCYQPTNAENEASARGTAQHTAADTREDNLALSDEHAAHVAECIEYCDNLRRKYPISQVDVLREEYLPIDAEPLPGGDAECTTAGYADYCLVCGEDGEIVDFKFGKHPVEPAHNNLQGIAYMLGLKKRFPGLKRVTVHFVQPVIDYVTQHTFDLSESARNLLYLRVRCVVFRAVEAHTSKSFKQARPNTGSCLFCARLAECPAVADLVLQVGKKFEPLSVPENIDPLLEENPKAMGLALKLAQLATVWGEAYRRTITARVIDEEGLMPEGYKLVQSTKSSVKDARQVVKIAIEFAPDAKEKLEALYDIPITKVDEVINAAAPRGKKQKTVEEFRKKAEESGSIKTGTPFAYLTQTSITDGGAESLKTKNQNT